MFEYVLFQSESVAVHSRVHQHQDHGHHGQHGHEQEYQDEEHDQCPAAECGHDNT